MPHTGRKIFFGFIICAVAYIIIGGILSAFASGRHKDPIFDQENKAWRASTSNPIDKALCYWVGLCGGFHYLRGSTAERIESVLPIVDLRDQWTSGPEDPSLWTDEDRQLREVPQYVLDYAPYVHLYSKEQYWPSDPAEHLAHTLRSLNYTELDEQRYGLANLDEVNEVDIVGSGRNVYLQSIDDVEGYPDWLGGRRNIPNNFAAGHGVRKNDFDLPSEYPTPKPRQRHQDLRRRRRDSSSTAGTQDYNTFGRSDAPAFLIVIPKEDGIVDAFWFFFYSFNKAPKVLNIQFGNHIGDWEHTLIRFRNGIPESVACSEHYFGSAYAYDALEKYLVSDSGDILSTRHNRTAVEEAIRPVVFSAGGSHAMYASPGVHPYILPFNVLRDETDRGPLWDPTLNLQAYTYDFKTLRAATRNPQAPTGWFDFAGRWGDKYYKLSDSRQYRFAGQYHYLNGPYGPKVKKLDRKHVCQSLERCVIKDTVDGRR